MLREYELYIPLLDEAGHILPDSKLSALKEELLKRFGGFTLFPQEMEGQWRLEGRTFRDRILILRVLAPDTEEARQWFADLKRRLEDEYGQESFLITVRVVESL